MANFRTHVTTSTVLGIGYAAAGHMAGIPTETAMVAGGLCGLSGMLPDIDSETGIPIRESMSFAAAVVPMLLVDRLQTIGLGYDGMVLSAGLIYFFIRFVLARLLSRYTVHRGMFHSVPAAFTFAGVAFLLAGCMDLELRYFKAGGVFLGFMSHLVLDEMYSVEYRGGRWNFKRSFGSAIKFWSRDPMANFSTYTKLLIVAALILSEPSVMQRIETRSPLLVDQLRRYKGGYDQWVQSLERNSGWAHGPLPAQSELADSGFAPNRSDEMLPSPYTTLPPHELAEPSPAPLSLSRDRTIYDTARRLMRHFKE